MSPVDQTVFGFGGNCQSACIAMILGIPLSMVPNFHEAAGEQDDNYGLRWNTAVDSWLASKGFGRMCVQAPEDWRERYRGFVAVAGKSPRGDFDHVCVYRDGLLWHDPHPDRAGLLTESAVEVYYALKGYSASGVGA